MRPNLVRTLRPRIGPPDVEPWYRYNSPLYVHADAIPKLPEAVAATRIMESAEIEDVAPLNWRFRRAILRRLPIGVVTELAVIKHRLALARRTYPSLRGH
jgi:hypothetical protein